MKKVLSFVLSVVATFYAAAGVVELQNSGSTIGKDFPSVLKPDSGKVANKSNKLRQAVAPKEDGLEGLTAYISYYSSWGGEDLTGLYNISETPVRYADIIGGAGRYDDGKGKLYTVESVLCMCGPHITTRVYDSDTYELLEEGVGDFSIIASDMAVNPVDGLPYGCFYNDDCSGFVWGVADYTTFTRRAIADLPEIMLGVGIDRKGVGYVIGNSGTVYKIDVPTGNLTEIGKTGIKCIYETSAAVDTKTGKFYFAQCTDNKCGIYEISTTTGEASLVYYFDGLVELRNLEFPLYSCEDNAPAAPAFEVKTIGGDLTADWTLTAPTTLFDGTEASGDISYVIKVDDKTIDEGTVAYGGTVTGKYEAESNSSYHFTAQLIGSDGLEGAVTRSKVYIGFGKPSAPDGVTLSYDESTRKATLTWEKVMTSSDGGYFEPDHVFYNVYDNEGNIIASDLSTTTLEITMPVVDNLTRFQYYIVANSNEMESAKAYSRTIILGNIIPPYTVDFEDPDVKDYFKIIDNNEDGKIWELKTSGDNTYLSITYNVEIPHDDYIVTVPGLKVKSGESYRVSVDAWAGAAEYVPEKVELVWGTEPTPESMTNVIARPEGIFDVNPVEVAGYLSLPHDGIVYIGIHAMSDADMLYLNIDNFKIVTGTSSIVSLSDSDVKVAVDGQSIIISNAEGMDIDIFTIDGKVIVHDKGDINVNLVPAVYVVKVGDKFSKVVVR